MNRVLRLGVLLSCLPGFMLVVPAHANAQQRPANVKIDTAVDRAVAYLRTRPWDYSIEDKKSGDWQYDAGAAALIGLALLESDVPPRDPMIVAAARSVRSAAPKLTKTYAISLAIMFLDRYGGSGETETIRDLAYRLVAGQNATSWGWSYDCPIVKDYRPILSILQQNRKLTEFGEYKPAGTACNSNTQFAVLALWIARRHTVPADVVLARAEARFRHTQHADGGWGYHHNTEGSSQSMTCSGLLGLAVGFGNRKAQLRSGGRIEDDPGGKVEDIRKDPKVELAKAWLGKQLHRQPQEMPHWPYFLWSLERVCVVYGFEEIDKVNWYDWGTKALLALQKENGSWDGGYPPQVNTAFALLFLRKANLARDLSGIAQLKAEGGDKGLLANPPPEAPKPDAGGNPARLAGELLTAKSDRQQAILKLLEETKDPTGTMTQALADVIPKLQGEVKEKARRALAGRLAVAALREYLTDADQELRLAAVRAAGIKAASDMVPDLILLVDSRDANLANAAEESLKAITKQDLGKNPQAWRDYFAKNKK